MTSALLTGAELAQLRARRLDPRFGAAWTLLLDRADRALADRLRPADQGAGWGHGYHCPEHVVVLEFDAARPDRHRCPVGGEERVGPEYDAGWRCELNQRIAGGVDACALAFQAGGEARYRDHVADILRDYARRYPALPPNGAHVGKGRVTGQSLEEAVWGISMARAYAVVAESLPAADRELIETDLLRGVADQVSGQLLNRIHNIECWHLASLATIGVVLGEPRYVALATEGDTALPAQLREGIRSDGWWAEGSPSYHYYMLSAALAAALALRHRSPEFLATPGLREMFAAPLSMMRDDLSLPALNDGWVAIAEPLGVASYAAHYEQAFGLWHDPADAAFLRLAYGRGATRQSEWALSMGPDLAAVPEVPLPARRAVHPASGYAVLSDGVGPTQRYLLLKYGPHGGGHGHPDKLEIDLYGYGVRLAPDAGSPSYNSPLQGPWVRQTLSHNTVLLGHRSQPETIGRLVGFVDPAGRPAGLADAVASWPLAPDPAAASRRGSWLAEPRRIHLPEYAGALVRRVVLWRSAPAGYLLDVVLVAAGAGTPIELAFHHRGELVDPCPAGLPADTGWAVPDEAYRPITDPRLLASGGPWYAAFAVQGAGTRVFGHDPAGARAVVAVAPSNPPAQHLALLLRAASGPAACFCAVLEPVRGDPSADGAGAVRAVRWQSTDLAAGGELAVVVELAGRTDTWSVRVAAPLSAGGADTLTATPGTDGGLAVAVELAGVDAETALAAG